jgi:hypothetical protein
MEPSSEPSSEKAYLSLGSTSLARAELARDMVVEGLEVTCRGAEKMVGNGIKV